MSDETKVSSSAIQRIERGRADRVPVHVLIRVTAALGASVSVKLLYQGEALDRLLDAAHADLVDATVALLGRDGWEVATEVSFNIRGERGSIDILAFHRPSGSLLVIEVKSVVPDLQAMFWGLDRKARLASDIARDRGWRVTTVSRLLVLPTDRTARRRVERHAATFDAALPSRTTAVRRWLRRPSGTMAGVLFLASNRNTPRHRVSRSTGLPAA